MQQAVVGVVVGTWTKSMYEYNVYALAKFYYTVLFDTDSNSQRIAGSEVVRFVYDIIYYNSRSAVVVQDLTMLVDIWATQWSNSMYSIELLK